jgi:eukaryotic-like serine/threonine-protein kinase
MTTPDPHARLALERLGTTLKGKWRLDNLLGVGGMAAVYSATHRNGSRAAVKLLHGHVAADGAMRVRFLREGYVANAVDHPGVVRVIDDDTTDAGEAFLVMELLEGKTLDSARRAGELSTGLVLDLMGQLLDVLAAAHEKGILHRDIKPENLFLTFEGRLKVLDFGIARVRDAASGGTSVTQTGATMGTPAFMAPEQALGVSAEVDARTDLWAVGATLFTLLTGRTVHEARSVNEQLVLAATRPSPSLAGVLPGAPPPLVAIVDRALAFRREDRFPTANAMRGALSLLDADVSHVSLGNLSVDPMSSTVHSDRNFDATLPAPTTTRGAVSAIDVGSPSRSYRGWVGAGILAAVAVSGLLLWTGGGGGTGAASVPSSAGGPASGSLAIESNATVVAVSPAAVPSSGSVRTEAVAEALPAPFASSSTSPSATAVPAPAKAPTGVGSASKKPAFLPPKDAPSLLDKRY